MTDLEFEILDELYFLTGFENLLKTIGSDEATVKPALITLIKKGWVKVLEKESDVEFDALSCQEFNLNNYNYLATKEGLLAHNSK